MSFKNVDVLLGPTSPDTMPRTVGAGDSDFVEKKEKLIQSW